MAKKLKSKRSFPWTGEVGGRKITFRLMTPEDREAAVSFTSTMDHEDVMLLQSDVTRPEVIDDWIGNIERGRAIILLAQDASKNVVGYASLYHNESSWTRHQGELRVFVTKRLRGTGVGKHLAGEITHVAAEQKLDIIVVNVPREQPHVRMMLEKIGFTAEALLADWLIDADGNTHDMIVMARRTKDF